MDVVTTNVSKDLQFLDVPSGGDMNVPKIEVGSGNFVFSYISRLVEFLQPHEYLTDFLQEWLSHKAALPQLVIKTIRIESGFILSVVVFTFLALGFPLTVIAQACCKLAHPGTGDCSPGSEPSVSSLRCRKIGVLVYMQIVILLIPFGFLGMFVSNSDLNSAVAKVPGVTQAVIEDIRMFVRNSQMQVRFVVTSSTDTAIGTSVKELDDIELLVGQPIQKEIAIETGIDVAFDALNEICTASKNVAAEIKAVRSKAQAVREMIKLSEDRLQELVKQIESNKLLCLDQDKPLCNTIDTVGLVINFRVDKILNERQLLLLRHLGEDNLTIAVETAHQGYDSIPTSVSQETQITRSSIKNILTKQKDLIYNSVEALDKIAKTFEKSISASEGRANKIVEMVADIEHWRWIVGLGASISVLVIWILMSFAIICDCCGLENKVVPSLLIALVLMCFLSIFLWALATVALLLGGNGQVYICKPLFDDPKYATLSQLLDNSGILYKKGGIFTNILKGNKSIDVPINEVLKECKENQPVFPTFSLNCILNVDSLSNHLTWPKLHANLSNLTLKMNNITILTPSLQKYLQDLSHAAKMNLTAHRLSISIPVTATNLGAFADHLETIANKMSDLTTSTRMEVLASRTRKLLTNYIYRLAKHKDELIYKLTSLEVHITLLQRRANQSLSHLKTIQFYLDSQGSTIFKKKSTEYVNNMIQYLEKFRLQISNQLTYKVAPCKPLWDIFHSSRELFCKNIVEPMNAFWVSTVWCLLLFMFNAPGIMILADFYKDVFVETQLHRDLSELLLEDQRMWSTQMPNSP